MSKRSEKADAWVEKAVMDLHEEPGFMTGYVLCASVSGLDGVTRYVIGAQTEQVIHHSVGLNLMLSASIDETVSDYTDILEEED